MMKPLLSCTVPIQPISWKRTAYVKGRRVNDKKLKQYEKAIALYVCSAFDREMIDEPVQVKLSFFFKRPNRLLKSDSPTGKVPHYFRPDLDNLAKAVKDAISKSRVWKDDCLVYSMNTEKNYAELGTHPRIEIEIWPERKCAEEQKSKPQM